MKFHLTLFPVIFLCTASCVSHKESLTESYKHNPANLEGLVGTYIVSDSSFFANPLYMLNQEEKYERNSHYANLFTIDSITVNKMYATYINGEMSERVEFDIRLKKRKIKIKSNWNVKSYLIVTAVSRSGVNFCFEENNSLSITKTDRAIGFLVVLPGFSAGRDFQFNYAKLGN